MIKYHITNDGPKKCVAQPGNCKLKDNEITADTKHYDNFQEAQAAYNKKMGKVNPIPTLTRKARPKNNKKKTAIKILSVGLIGASMSLTACSNVVETSHDLFNDKEINQLGRDTKDYAHKAKEKGEKAWEHAKPKAEELAKKGKKATENLKDKGLDESRKALEKEAKKKLEEYKTKVSGALGNPTTPTRNPGEVIFQGKSLKVSPAELSKAKETLKSIKVAPERDASNYNRNEMYGGFKSGVVARAEHRDIPNGKFDNASATSRAIGGSFIDPYTGEKVTVIKGSTNDTNVDHIVPLKEVERSIDPARPLQPYEKTQIANDLKNLQIVNESVNKSKSDSDANGFLPTYKPAQCRYAISIITVKKDYHLTVDPAELGSLQSVLNTKCNN